MRIEEKEVVKMTASFFCYLWQQDKSRDHSRIDCFQCAYF